MSFNPEQTGLAESLSRFVADDWEYPQQKEEFLAKLACNPQGLRELAQLLEVAQPLFDEGVDRRLRAWHARFDNNDAALAVELKRLEKNVPELFGVTDINVSRDDKHPPSSIGKSLWMGLAGVVGTIAASIVLLLVLNLEVRRSEYPTAHHQDPVSRKPATLGEPEGVYQIQQEQGPEWQQRELLQAASEHIMASLEMMDTLLDIAGEEEKWLVRDVFEVVVSNQISNGERLSRFTGEPIDSKDWAEILRNTEEYTERSERLYHQIFALIALYNTDRSLRDAFAVIYGFSPDSNNPVAVREQVERFLQVQD